jgi:hypothetical protein
MIGQSPWAVSETKAAVAAPTPLHTLRLNDFEFAVILDHNSLKIRCTLPNQTIAICRAAFAPSGTLELEATTKTTDGLNLVLTSDIGQVEVKITFQLTESRPIVRYTTTLTPAVPLLIPFWPRDLIFTSANGKKTPTAEIHSSQRGARSGLIYLTLTKPKSASVLYLQNLSALANYNQQTETSAADTVGGTWPELGFALPAANEKPLTAGTTVVISDAIVIFDPAYPKHQQAIMTQYLDLLATAYLMLPKPVTNYQQWPDILQKGLTDLTENPGCCSLVAGHKYFNAYVSDYETPPEIMVQLAVLLPLTDYVAWSGEQLPVIEEILAGLPSFYDEELKTIVRWHPAAVGQLKGEEEQKKPNVMDSWYLHHPLLNLSRLALAGNGEAKTLFLNSIGYAIKVAKHFKYKWPVFYEMDSLKVIKAETAEGAGGEKDVAGIYVHILLQAFELTQDEKYLREAERAAKTLAEYGFDIFYQANNTAFSAGALLRLHKLTKNSLYLELSYQCLAAIFTNVQLWDCNYGYGTNFPKFFSLYPLNDAPYTAVYEEQEVFCALHDYLKNAEGVEILPSIKLLLAEYIRYMVDRAAYYYPTLLPSEMLQEKPKVGELDPKLWIALEDLQDGWDQSGQVGQEVYGAGNAFGILPRHYIKVGDGNFMVYIDYPYAKLTKINSKTISFNVLGDDRLHCRLMLVKTTKNKLPLFTVSLGKAKNALKGKRVANRNFEYELPGNQRVHISWT